MTAITSDNDEALLHQMVETIVREVSPETIILFGSRARGDALPDSYVDLLVVETEPFSPQRSRRNEAARLYMALRGLAISKDILLYSHDEPKNGSWMKITVPQPSHNERFSLSLTLSPREREFSPLPLGGRACEGAGWGRDRSRQFFRPN